MARLKWSVLVMTLLLSLPLVAQEDSSTIATDSTLVYVFNIKEEIGPPIMRQTGLAFDKAEEIGADAIFIRMNTYGGLVYAADSIRTRILYSDIPVYVFIENNAASAGALISIACDKIFMRPGSTIGAATVVSGEGEKSSEKMQSYMRNKMRATAEEKGRDPDIAEGMVDEDKEIPGIIEAGKLITLTTDKAVELGYCDGEANTMNEALALAGLTPPYKPIVHEISEVEGAISWLINPAVSGILILIIIGGIYFELQTPGVGFPILASIIAAVMFFAPLYLHDLADNWEIVLFIVGVILIALEVFVIPGFGVAGISGIIAVLTGLAFSLVGNVNLDFSMVDGEALLTAFLVVMLSSVTSVVGSIFLGMKLLSSGPFSRYVLNASQNRKDGFVGTDRKNDEMVGKTGIAETVLRPSGKVEISGRLYDATADIGFIEAGTPVVVLKSETSSLLVARSEA